MAKNRVMQAKNAKVKKCRQQSIREKSIDIMSHEPFPIEIINYVPYTGTEFTSNAAIKCRIIAFMGRHYNIIRFQKRYPDIFLYISKHTVSETKEKFTKELELIMQGSL